VSDILADYSNTFSAFSELINNAIQAKAKNIDITIKEVPQSKVSDLVISSITVKDNGHGVSESEFDKKILEVATNSKTGGKGIGRFAAFQLGEKIEIDTVAYDEAKGKFTQVSVTLNEADLRKSVLNEAEITTKEKTLDKEANTYYSVTISNFHPSTTFESNRKKKVHENLLVKNIANALFERYPNKIFNNENQFKVNGKLLKKDDFIIGNPQKIRQYYHDKFGKKHEIRYTYLNVKKATNDVKVFLTIDNAGIQTVAHTFDFNAEWLSPKVGSFFIYIESNLFDVDMFRNIDFDLDENTRHLKKHIKETLTQFLIEKNKDFEDFTKTLKKDKFYPYLNGNATSKTKEIVFDKFAYLIEDKYLLLKNQDELRGVIYSLIDKSLSNGKLEDVLKSLVTLNKENIDKFHNLLKLTPIENVIEFSEHVAIKNQFIDKLYELTYGDISKRLKERSELHKIIEKELWIFGERYSDTPSIKLDSDKNLENNLNKLRKKYLEYPPKKNDENLDITIKGKAKTITDLFFYNEKVLDNESREIMVVELKAPKVKISKKEISQVELYANQILTKTEFSKDNTYKVIIISSHLSDYAETDLKNIERPDPKNKFCYKQYNKGKVEVWIMTWMDIINMNRKKLSYLGKVLKTSDKDTSSSIENDLKEIKNNKIRSRLSTTIPSI
jgi:hypothetical protein